MSSIRFMSFSSGSCGNCYYLECEGESILIDAGASIRCLKKYMSLNGLEPESFHSILVTHDHLDHIRNLGSYCKRLGKPVYASAALHGALSRHPFTSAYIPSCRRILEEGKWNPVGGMQVRYFTVPHDASHTCGFAISISDRRFFIMTDAGGLTDEAMALAAQADVVVIESNYDRKMLMEGPYPADLKKRICGGHGHLSNDECAAAVKRFWHPGLKAIFLCHLSENNNTPELAYKASLEALKEMGVEPGSLLLKPLPRDYPSALFTL